MLKTKRQHTEKLCDLLEKKYAKFTKSGSLTTVSLPVSDNFAFDCTVLAMKKKGNQLKGVGMLHDNAKYKGYNFYLKGNDAIDTEYPTTEESNALYSAFYFDRKEAIADVTAGFRGKIDGFLEG